VCQSKMRLVACRSFIEDSFLVVEVSSSGLNAGQMENCNEGRECRRCFVETCVCLAPFISCKNCLETTCVSELLNFMIVEVFVFLPEYRVFFVCFCSLISKKANRS